MVIEAGIDLTGLSKDGLEEKTWPESDFPQNNNLHQVDPCMLVYEVYCEHLRPIASVKHRPQESKQDDVSSA